MKIKLRNIKKWQKIDPDQLQRAWEQRYAPPKHTTPTEEEFITSAAEMKPQRIYYGEKAPKDLQDVANVFGVKTTQVKFQEHMPVTEKVERIAQDIEFRVTAKKLGKSQQAVQNIASKNPKRFTTKHPRIGKTLPKSDWAHKDPKLTKAILIARKETKPKSVITKGNLGIPQKGKKFSEESARSYFKLTPMSAYKGIGKARTGEELQIKYKKVASRAVMHGKGAGERFIKQVRDKGTPVRNVRDVEKKFLKIKKRGQVPEQAAVEMGFPAKSPGGQYKPFEGLEDYKPFTDPRKIPDESINQMIRNESNLLYVGKAKIGQKERPIKRVLAKQFVSRKQLSEEGYTGYTREKAVKLKPFKHTETYGGRHIPDWKMSASRKKYASKLLKDSPKIKTYSRKTQTLYPPLARSAETKFWKRVEKEWGKKKGRTPFDF